MQFRSSKKNRFKLRNLPIFHFSFQIFKKKSANKHSFIYLFIHLHISTNLFIHVHMLINLLFIYLFDENFVFI